MALALIGAWLAAPAEAADTSKTVIGTTPALIHAKFPGVIHNNLASYVGAARLAKLSSRELQDLAYAYARETGGNTTDLVTIARVYAPTQVARMQAAATNALAGWANTNTVYRIQMVIAAGPAPTIDMTLQEIYLEFRTAPVGALSVESSVYMTTAYAMTNLTAAYGAGYLIGTGIHWLIETYAPELDNKIGAAMDATLTYLANAPTLFMQGVFEDRLDTQFFFIPLVDLAAGPDFGDWGVLDDIEFYLDMNYCLNPGDC